MLCVLDIDKNAYYHYINVTTKLQENRVVYLNDLISIYAESGGIYGATKIQPLLCQKGYTVSIAKVSRDMVLLGIASIRKTNFPHKKSHLTDEEKKLIINLVKGVTFTQINQAWSTDVTYIHTINDGTLYLISFLDMYSRKIVAWGLFRDQKTDKILSVLQKGVKMRKPKPGLIVHSDKGAQFRSKMYRDYLRSHNYVFSYTSLNHSCDENAGQESFHSIIKMESIYSQNLYTFNDALYVITHFIEGFYNNKRIHSSIGNMSPINFEENQKKLKTLSKSGPNI